MRRGGRHPESARRDKLLLGWLTMLAGLGKPAPPRQRMAARLGVTAATVTATLRRLSLAGLIRIEHRGVITIVATGKSTAAARGPGPRPTLTEAELAPVREAHAAGLTVRQIGRRTYLTDAQVEYRLKRLDLKPRRSKQYRTGKVRRARGELDHLYQGRRYQDMRLKGDAWR